jgi:hypothetical protein
MAKKKGWVLNYQFDSQPLKVGNHPDLFMCKLHATYCWKDLDKGYNSGLDFIPIGGLQKKLWASKVTKVVMSKILGLSTWEIGIKWHLNVGPVAMHKEYYKVEGDRFPQVRTMMNLVSSCLPMVRPCTKSALTMH